MRYLIAAAAVVVLLAVSCDSNKPKSNKPQPKSRSLLGVWSVGGNAVDNAIAVPAVQRLNEPHKLAIEFRSDGSVLENGRNFGATWKGNTIHCDKKKLEAHIKSNPMQSQMDAVVLYLLVAGNATSLAEVNPDITVAWVDDDHFDVVVPPRKNMNTVEERVAFARIKGL
jgi:hypothetical protein